MSPATLLSNHGLVLLCVAQNPDSRLRDIAEFVGITERAAHRLVSDLVEAGYLTRTRVGNRNRYGLQSKRRLSHPASDAYSLGDLLEVLGANEKRSAA